MLKKKIICTLFYIQAVNSRFSRQLSNPAYFNPRMRMGAPPNGVNAMLKSPIVSPGVSPTSPSRHSPTMMGDVTRPGAGPIPG